MSLIALTLNSQPFQITTNFSSSEIIEASHPDVGADCLDIDENVVMIAQIIRNNTGKSVNVNSAYRNSDYNATLPNSSPVSQHTKSTALDLSGDKVSEFMHNAYTTKNENWQQMYALGLRGLGFYTWGVHIDTRNKDTLALWGYKKKSQNIIMLIFALILGLILILKK